MMPQRDLTADTLAARLTALLTSPDELSAAATQARAAGTPDAAERLADLVLSMIPMAGGCPAAALPKQGAA
jgi:UDP-N-acetylglucosamine--N-acetylmuramyl-(pentapeptide) pyrophosphoryl-undecaprenol N-acetylglucosamine transferase